MERTTEHVTEKLILFQNAKSPQDVTVALAIKIGAQCLVLVSQWTIKIFIMMSYNVCLRPFCVKNDPGSLKILCLYGFESNAR